MSRNEKVLLSSGITNFQDTNIKFLSNKDEKTSTEELIHEWLDSKLKFNRNKSESSNEKYNESNLKEKFMNRNIEDNEYKLTLIKKLNLEDKIKDDLLKDLIFDSNLLSDPQVKNLQEKKNSISKKIKIFIYLITFYSFFTFAQFYDQKLNKFNNIQDMINKKQKTIDFKFKYNLLIFSILFGGLTLFYGQKSRVDRDFRNYVKSNHLTLTEQDLQKFKVHMKI